MGPAPGMAHTRDAGRLSVRHQPGQGPLAKAALSGLAFPSSVHPPAAHHGSQLTHLTPESKYIVHHSQSAQQTDVVDTMIMPALQGR